FFAHASRERVKAELDLSRAQLLKQRASRCDGNVKNNARILPRQPIDDGENDSFGGAGGGSYSQFTGGGIGQELDILNPLVDLVEGGDTPFEQCTPILCWIC